MLVYFYRVRNEHYLQGLYSLAQRVRAQIKRIYRSLEETTHFDDFRRFIETNTELKDVKYLNRGLPGPSRVTYRS
jgi:hypothetical protein